MGKMGKFSLVFIAGLLFSLNSNLVALAHDGAHDNDTVKDQSHEETNNKDQNQNQLLTAQQLNIIRRERQRDKLHSLFTKVIGTQDPEDQYRLGMMFQSGDGVAKDDIQAYVWTALSLTNGYPGATKTLRDLENDMSTYEVNYAIDLLRKIRELR